MHGVFQTSKERDWVINLKHFCLSLSYYNCMISSVFFDKAANVSQAYQIMEYLSQKNSDINFRHFYHELLESSHNSQRTSSSVSSLGASSLEASLKGQVCSHTRDWRQVPEEMKQALWPLNQWLPSSRLFSKATFLPLREQSMASRSIKDINQEKCQQKWIISQISRSKILRILFFSI